jgi:hypothetical protein
MFGAIGLGAALRLLQFASGTSLWLDELAIANNVAERSLWALLREPLAYAQVAPPGFIAFEKVMYGLFGPNDYALRLYSLLTGIGALGAVALVAVRMGLRETAWVAPLLLALGSPFIFQSAQVKPYAGDVFLALALVALALRLRAEPASPRTLPIALGVLAPWFSFAASFMLAGIGLALLLSPQRRRYLPVVALWAVSVLAALSYATMLVDRGTTANMLTFWSRNGAGFPAGLAEVIPWSLAQLRAHLWSEIGLRGVTYWLGIVGISAALLWWRNRFALVVIAAPVLAAIVAAALRRYPLGSRLSHWIAALLILLIAVAAAEGARALARARFAKLVPIPGVLVALLPLLAFTTDPPPYRVEDVKPVFAEMRRARQSGDWLYVYPGAWHAYRYYGAYTGIAPERVVFGDCSRRSLRESLAPVDALRGGARVWVLFTHVTSQDDRELVLSYLDRIGVRRSSMSLPDPYERASSSVDVHLYDLSDPQRLGTTAWQTFAASRGDVPSEPSVCSVGMVPRGALPRIERTGEVVRD